MMNKLPVLFITHGSPMLAIEPEKTGTVLTQLGKELSTLDINAVLVISAHWLTPHKPMITAALSPETIHDFGGFPLELYTMQYPAKGSAQIASLVLNTLKDNHITSELNNKRGLDHGAWIPLQYLFPNAEIPVLQLSMPWPLDASNAIHLGHALQKLREQGILIIASGSMTHNLSDVGYDKTKQESYIQPFVDWVDNTIKSHDLKALANYRQLAPYAAHAHPTDEHFLPLLIAVGATDKQDVITSLDAGVSYEALAMKHYVFGQYH